MPAFNSINIKDLTKIEEVVSGNLLIIETENGTNTIDFENFVVGPDNVSWYTAFETVSAQVASLSADLGQVNFTERSALTALSAEVQLLEANFYTLTANVNTLSSNFIALSSNVTNPTVIVYTAGFGFTTFPQNWNTAKITVVGGGGGGGGANATVAAGGGGGSGAISIGYVSGIGGRTYLYKVGPGGAGGAAGSTGNTGDSTSVLITTLNYGISALGGSGGTGNSTTGNLAAGGAGGLSTGGGNAAYTFSGNTGDGGIASTVILQAQGGNGGSGYLGLGYGLGNVGQTGGIGGAGSFGGGGGGGRQNFAGGQGGAGFIQIELIA